uniref:Expressed protein n=1 Tax=Schizophyllum commune (strain H4-8 / FGSC 9210) TaxID=578458 RepID=D8PPL5_SCHCM
MIDRRDDYPSRPYSTHRGYPIIRPSHSCISPLPARCVNIIAPLASTHTISPLPSHRSPRPTQPPTKPKAPYFIPRRCRARACLRAYPAVFLLYLILLSGYGTRSTSMRGGVGWWCVCVLLASGVWRWAFLSVGASVCTPWRACTWLAWVVPLTRLLVVVGVGGAVGVDGVASGASARVSGGGSDGGERLYT